MNKGQTRPHREQPDLFSDNPEKPESHLLDDIDELFELSAEAHHVVSSAQMNEALVKADLERYVQKILSAVRAEEFRAGSCPIRGGSGVEIQLAARSAAEKAAFDRGDPLVRTVLGAAYRVDREIHRLMGLLRFNPRPDGLWLARCAPDNFILPAFAEHFTARFGESSWAIIDEKRSLALVRLSGKDPCFGALSSFPFLSGQELAQDDWEELWRSYHRSINIENRKNPLLQLQLMPRRYWKYLPEIKL